MVPATLENTIGVMSVLLYAGCCQKLSSAKKASLSYLLYGCSLFKTVLNGRMSTSSLTSSEHPISI